MIAEYLSLLALATSALANRNTSGIRGKLNLTYLFTANITTSSTISIGTTPFGERVFDPITGGSFSGPRLEGHVASGGAEWGITGSNGVFNPDVAYVLETHDGGNILVRERGRASNVFSVFETGSDKYDWLNSVVAYGKVTVMGTGVSLEFWQVGTTSL